MDPFLLFVIMYLVLQVPKIISGRRRYNFAAWSPEFERWDKIHTVLSFLSVMVLILAFVWSFASLLYSLS